MTATIEENVATSDQTFMPRALPVECEFVSVVIPCYNEERFIVKALEQLAGQYEKSRFEIIVVDGRSEDQTRDLVSEFRAKHADLSVTLIDNPKRNIPTA